MCDATLTIGEDIDGCTVVTASTVDVDAAGAIEGVATLNAACGPDSCSHLFDITGMID
jgi:hypothetical protein